MDDLYSRIVHDRGSVQNLFARIPGFRGYMEMSARRQADRLIREYVAGQLQQQLNRMPVVETMLLDAGGLSYMSKTRSVKTKFQTLVDRVATDMPGYSGFFDALKVEDDDLAVVYAFDEAMLRYADEFGKKLDALQNAAMISADVDEAIRDLDALTIEASQAYSLREDVLKGIARDEPPDMPLDTPEKSLTTLLDEPPDISEGLSDDVTSDEEDIE
ncbi:MAG: hypothetical protein JXJ20_05615 [Anaerolineae bacterium]|jgi:hypothetical protein|nr:hypothetical protein [Anaerolineae bacterium]